MSGKIQMGKINVFAAEHGSLPLTRALPPRRQSLVQDDEIAR
jgi:hypothetical protein